MSAEEEPVMAARRNAEARARAAKGRERQSKLEARRREQTLRVRALAFVEAERTAGFPTVMTFRREIGTRTEEVRGGIFNRVQQTYEVAVTEEVPGWVIHSSTFHDVYDSSYTTTSYYLMLDGNTSPPGRDSELSEFLKERGF